MIWFAIVMSTFIYAVIVYALSRDWPRPGALEASLQKTVVLVLYVLAIADFVMAHVLSRMMSNHRARYVSKLALFASCAIYGLLAAFLTQDWRLYIPAWALALIGFAQSYPSDATTPDLG